MYIIDRTKRTGIIRNSRAYDYHELSKEMRTNPDPHARALAEKAMNDIKLESKSIRDMREALIRAHRRGEKEEIKDIHSIVASKKKYHHE
jgi:hypothetical protein